MTNKQYNEYIENRAERSPCLFNCIKAFLVGGIICCLAEALSEFYIYLGAEKDRSLLFASLTLILLSGLFSGIGFFDKIAKFAGAGTLVPITGFANAVASAAIEAKTEGFVTGVGAKMFTIAGPVIVYGTSASIIYGFIYWLCETV